jgi:hypothetical protein
MLPRTLVAAGEASLLSAVVGPNARHEPLPKAGAQRTLEAVGSMPLLGSVPVPGGLRKRFLTPFLLLQSTSADNLPEVVFAHGTPPG